MTQNHIIERQTMRTKVLGNAEQGADVQQQVAELMQSTRYMKALDEVLNEFGRAGQWLNLETIELNIGYFRADDLDRQFIPKLIAALREKLYDAIPDAVLQGKMVSKTEQQFGFEAFSAFLVQGVFKSYLPHKLGEQTSFETWAKALIEQLTDKQIADLRILFQHNKTARQRLFYQFSKDILFLIFKKINADTPLSILTFDNLKRLGLSTEKAFFDTVIDFLYFKTINNRVAELKPFEDFIASVFSSKTTKAAQRKAVLDFIEKALSPDIMWRDAQYSDKKDAAQLDDFKFKNNGEQGKAPPLYLDDFEAKNSVTKATESGEQDVIYIQNAGIVLVHLFLKFCFVACGWLKDEGFKNEKAQQKALLMLHFLATGQTKAAEFELFLPKILCNVPESDFILIADPDKIGRGGIVLTKKEKAEGESMLKAAIEHWKVLKNTSPDGLREAFLQREGKLERNPFGGWTLTVEQKAQDVLLGQLPYGWGVSLVKLDWMKEILQVNWA